MRFMFMLSVIVAFSLTSLSQTPPERSRQTTTILKEISEKNLKNIITKLAEFGTRHTLSDTLSAVRGIGAARRWIKSEFERYALESHGMMSVEMYEKTVPSSYRIPNPTKIVDVIATLHPAGSEASGKRMFIIGGHYDSRVTDIMNAVRDAPGADDDGSGTALTMELARVFARHTFNATIKFIAYAGEEQGLYGSDAWAEHAKQNLLPIVAVFNNDIVGGTEDGSGKRIRSYVRLFSEAFSPADCDSILQMRNHFGLENDGGSRSLARIIKDLAEKYNPEFKVRLVYRLDRFSRGGDQWSFHKRGYSAVRFTEVSENYDRQHEDVKMRHGKQYGDLPQFIDYPYLLHVAKANAAALATLAAAPEPPPSAHISTSLGTSTMLRWQKSPDDSTAGYEVRYRETDASEWQGEVFTRDTTLVLDVSKDEYLFGIQSVDRLGNRSLVTIPQPE